MGPEDFIGEKKYVRQKILIRIKNDNKMVKNSQKFIKKF
jgi:hypothetical protein